MIVSSHLTGYGRSRPINPDLLPLANSRWLTKVDWKESAGRMISDDNDVPVAISDNDLLMRVAEKQDCEAFAQLFKSIAPRIKAYMMKLGARPDAAEEIAQETLIAVWRKSTQFDRQK
jgi:hypothetical protein